MICHIFCNLLLPPRQICNNLYRDRASDLNKTLCTLTCNLLTIKLVPRHSYNSISIVPGPPSPRLRRAKTAKNAPPSRSASSGHGMLRSIRPQRDSTPNRGYYPPAFIRTDVPSGRSVPSAQQRLRTLLPGR